jgi:hypothetical protein
LVNTAASNATPSTRRWSRLCDETSIATRRTPRSTSMRSTRWSSTGPGVVSPLPPGTGSPAEPTSTPSVPIDALGASAASSTWRRSPTVVVFPFVPVTAVSWSDAAGSPWNAAAATAAASRPSRTTSAGRAVAAGSSTTAALAPAPAAAAR